PRIRFFQLDANRDFTHVPGAERAHLSHSPNAYQRPGQFDIGIRIHVDGGLHTQAQLLRIHLVDRRIEHHRPRIHDLYERLARRHLVAFPDLAELAVAYDALHYDDAIHRSLYAHLLDVGLGAAHFDLGLVAIQLVRP